MPLDNPAESALLIKFRQLFSIDQHVDFDLESEIKQLKHIEKSLPPTIGLYLLDLHSFRYAYMSQRSMDITGISPQNYEQKGLNYFFEHLHPEDRLIIINKTLPLYKKALEDCDHEERLHLNASLNYRIKPETSENEEFRHVLSQLSIKSVSDAHMPLLLLGVFSQLKLEQYRGQDFKLYLNEEGRTTRIILDERLSSNPLTEKELQVLSQLSLGLSSKQIAESLFISKHTVDTHRRNVLKKLDVQNSIEAVIYCRSMGWI